MLIRLPAIFPDFDQCKKEYGWEPPLTYGIAHRLNEIYGCENKYKHKFSTLKA